MIFLGIIITSTDFSDLKRSFSRANLSNGVPEALLAMVLMGSWFPLWDRFVAEKEWLFWLVVLKLVMGGVLCGYFYLTSKGEKLLGGYRQVIWILIPVAVLDAAAYWGTTWGYSATANTTSLITLIANAYSVPTIILAYFLLKERVNRTQAVGIACILGGIVVSSL
ncbi:hypothetical protein A2368_01265 [Candidatus Collierbacteria bacterium RIFOXYB1_FULL_49_13]|uniref:EamA domain-containing protein n=1 Tax=Candidatus Collierbacteria bacterium RIFOXYB1_FULL_49_13 TaxID=1817728 RepID=A0A1F5FJI9_9BACT|nr:MAG: hypothetical protein A2368_01265 [Candidatus Collierbacteria bacterium RIFOXYB1_FULL_49_13]